MPTLIRILTPTATEHAPYSADSLADAARHEPHDGVYTITNTVERTKALKLDAHLDRLESSAAQAGIPLALDRSRLRAVLRQLILDTGYPESRFRITVPQATPERLILTVEPFIPPSDEIVSKGVAVVTVPNSARHNAGAKTTDWMHDRGAIESALPSGVYTALLCDVDGYILEGLSSNFYAVVDGELRTAGGGVLPGIAQQIVFEVTPSILPLRKNAIHLNDIARVNEAFITSSSRGILPVVRIDAVTLGDGAPGIYTRKLRAAYIDWANAHLEEI
jgi:branched-chain amino acid aminotransferase